MVCTQVNHIFEKLDLCLNIPQAIIKTVHRIDFVRFGIKRALVVFLGSFFSIIGEVGRR